MKNDDEIIIECGVEGVILTLLGTSRANAWRFRAIMDEGTVFDFLNEGNRVGFEPCHESDWVDSWKAALALLDKYPWHSFYPLRVRSGFQQATWAAVQERCRRDKHDRWRLHPKLWRLFHPKRYRNFTGWLDPYHFDDWRRVCHWKPDWTMQDEYGEASQASTVHGDDSFFTVRKATPPAVDPSSIESVQWERGKHVGAADDGRPIPPHQLAKIQRLLKQRPDGREQILRELQRQGFSTHGLLN